MEKHLKGIKSIKLDLTDGFCPIQTETEIEMNKISMWTGHNGVGKSVILKFNWALATILNNCIINDKYKVATDLGKMIQFTLDNTFSDQDCTGEISGNFECGSFISIKLEKGKLVDFETTYEADISPCNQPIFMSKDTRTFTEVIRYLKFKKAIGINCGISSFSEDQLFKICDMYKLYDILFMEMLFMKIDSKVLNHVEPMLGETKSELEKAIDSFNIKRSIKDISIDYIKSDITFNENGKINSMSSLSAGEQSLLMMFIGNLN